MGGDVAADAQVAFRRGGRAHVPARPATVSGEDAGCPSTLPCRGRRSRANAPPEPSLAQRVRVRSTRRLGGSMSDSRSPLRALEPSWWQWVARSFEVFVARVSGRGRGALIHGAPVFSVCPSVQ